MCYIQGNSGDQTPKCFFFVGFNQIMKESINRSAIPRDNT